MAFDYLSFKREFPYFQTANAVVYLDNAATALKPQAFETQLFFCFDFLVDRLDFLLDELEVFFQAFNLFGNLSHERVGTLRLHREERKVRFVVLDFLLLGFKRLSSEQIARAADIYHTWQSEGTDGSCYEVPELYRSVGIDEIAANNWALTPSKYIEFIDHDLDIDYATEMARIQAEMQEIMRAEKQSQQMLEAAFRGIGYGII
mgnify:CR=1 FL=1